VDGRANELRGVCSSCKLKKRQVLHGRHFGTYSRLLKQTLFFGKRGIPSMYEIHPNFADQWVLYDTSAGNVDVVGWFHGREDAEYAREAFEKRRRQKFGTFSQAGKLRPESLDEFPGSSRTAEVVSS
jgi:hypothetical protein